MNNLLRTLSEHKSKALANDTDLKPLLASIHAARKQAHDGKISDPFYESLEGVLVDLRTTTIDNHDSEAFLKPVSRSEVPDYYDVIKNPMDLQTMLKRVKARHYKTKAEFKSDLELIWNNCLTYNAVEGHPLRACALRLRVRANRLLINITDRKERQDPRIPGALLGVAGEVRMSSLKPSNTSTSTTSPVTVNGSTPTVNGVNGVHSRPPTITIKPRKSMSGEIPQHKPLGGVKRDVVTSTVPFENMPALVRTAQGMQAFATADARLEWDPTVLEPYLPPDIEGEVRIKTEDSDSEVIDTDTMVGDKRRWNGSDALGPPRKRSRPDVDPNTWWTALRSDTLLANGLPHIPHASWRPPTQPILTSPSKSKQRRTDKGKGVAKETTLLARMNNNIRTMRRLRDTHARFAALGLGNNNGPTGPDDEPQPAILPPPAPPPPPLAPVEILYPGGKTELDDRPWGAEAGIGLTPKQWRKRRRKAKALGLDLDDDEEVPTIEIGSENAEQCMRWMGSKILEHSGFQGTSQVALDVLASVTSEYLLNVGRTMRYLTDKYAKTMTAEEIILHTLFESGVSRVQELERYVRDDVERHGSRLSDLEKKLDSAYSEVIAGEIIDDDTLFEEDEENDGALTLGDFAEALGEDYLGLRELGIAAEFGMSNLSIPKKLLRRRRTMGQAANAAPAPPPLPYPLPPPFISLSRGKLEEQIGLLQPFYLARFNALAEASAQAAANAIIPPLPGPALPSLPGPTLPPLSGPSLPGIVPHTPSAVMPPPPLPAAPILPTLDPAPRPPIVIPSSMILPDDIPTGIHTKMGPLGQIVLPGAKAVAATAAKKKVIEKDKDKDGGEKKKAKKVVNASANGNGPGAGSPNKKKPNGNGGKSDAALMPPPPLPMPVVAVGT
ncbi:SAGA complex protein [Mycena indigotica]|uniref:SAGA complex protein n=1 Tax=Mycena indigotica TaxID=2126181 RepID=A0A8H6T308_9AGAR|nr:SAGA complex protein [Mycena indigotica]KAF7309930.1 SAGA complex protein [Mycena indigotica]